MVISHIKIQNFRSILSFSEAVRPLNILVGQNDEGKSNVLRALDLFFNGARRDGYEFDWARDYCSFTPARKRKAEEIVVELEITPPASFKSQGSVVWRKVWRRDGLHEETRKYSNGDPFDARSKLDPFLKSIRYDYVPAIKGADYFRSLMTSVHDMLEATVEDEVRKASGSFTQTINQNTKPILEDIAERLKLATTIELPPNLRDLFAQLEFTSLSGDKPFSLAQRGDGIKVRHVPIVLRWLATQANHLSAPGRPKAVTIWGYEEPENNLELRRCFELASEFVSGSASIQTFVTTHSPAFYSVARDTDPDTIRLFHVTKAESPPTTTITPVDSNGGLAPLDSAMGLLEFLDPHLREMKRELEQLHEIQKSLHNTAIPTLFCEGPSDKMVLEAALRVFFPEIAQHIAVRCSEDGLGGGHEWVADMLLAWSFNRPSARAVGLFDADEGAQCSSRRVKDRIEATKGKNKKIDAVILKITPHLITCAQRGIRVPYAIEELFPDDIWDHADAAGWLEDRDNAMSLYKFKDPNISFVDYMQGKLPEANLHRLALRRVRSVKKEAFSKYVTRLPDGDRARVFEAFKPTLEACIEALAIT